jgi:hypothetical protein
MKKKPMSPRNGDSHVISPKSDESREKKVTLSNEFIDTFTQIIFREK